MEAILYISLYSPRLQTFQPFSGNFFTNFLAP